MSTDARRVFRVAQVIAVNAVPLIGYFRGHWTPGTVLALYWFENLVASILIAVRVYLHRKLTNARGHYVLNVTKTRTGTTTNVKRSVGTVLQGYLIFAVGFTIGHAIFLGVIIAALQESAAIDLGQLRFGAESIAAFLLIGFILDLGSIRRRPFSWIRVMTAMMYFRVIVIQLTVVLGVGLIAIFNAPRAAALFFMVLKLLVDLLGTQIKDEVPVEGDENLPFDAGAREKLLASARPRLPK